MLRSGRRLVGAVDDSVSVGPAGHLVRVLRTDPDTGNMYVQRVNGSFSTGTTTGDHVKPGNVLLVMEDDDGAQRVEVVPSELWPDATWVAVVRVVLDDGRLLVDRNGTLTTIRARESTYVIGNTVEVSDIEGVVGLLSEEPIRHLGLGDEIPAASSYLVKPGDNPPTYNDFVGLDDVRDRVREIVELPLTRRSLLVQIGVKPVKGVLFTGPPGTGKTMLARVVAASLGVNLYLVRGPEILAKYYGDSERVLRDIFDEASRNQPAIVFFDEIDSVAGRRTDDGHEASKRVVAQLLSLMDDGLSSQDDVLVVATTNRVDDVDPALRRPGRFDWEIAFPLPDEAGRVAILARAATETATRGPLELEGLAARTHGWSPAELTALWTEAALLAVGDERRVVMAEDLQEALRRVGGRPRVAGSG